MVRKGSYLAQLWAGLAKLRRWLGLGCEYSLEHTFGLGDPRRPPCAIRSFFLRMQKYPLVKLYTPSYNVVVASYTR